MTDGQHTFAWDGWTEEQFRKALADDIGTGDLTSLALVDAGATARAVIRAREPLVVCGAELAMNIFGLAADYLGQQAGVWAEVLVDDGTAVEAGTDVLRVEGPARELLAGERTALNVMQRLSGIATATARLVARLAPYGTKLLDTRKTLPGWRHLDKYAVACGGGTNHRMGLYDAILIKDNHLAFWQGRGKGTLADAVRAARERFPDVKLEIEVDTLDQLREALPGQPDWVLLDNFTPAQVADAVSLCRGKCLTEASGGITEATAEAYAAAGVDAISIGALTHSPKAADLGLDFEKGEERPAEDGEN